MTLQKNRLLMTHLEQLDVFFQRVSYGSPESRDSNVIECDFKIRAALYFLE